MILDPVTVGSGVTLTAFVVEDGLTGDPNAVGGDAAGAGSGIGSLTLDQAAAGGAGGAGAAAGQVDLDQGISGDAAGAGDGAGGVIDSNEQPISGNAAGSADAAGGLDLGQSVSGDAAGSADAAGDVSAIDTISGDATATGDAAGAVVLDQALSGAADGSADAAGDVSISGALSVTTFANMNSGYDYSSEGPDAKIPVWIARYSGEAGHAFAANANFGNPESYVYPPGSTFGDAEVVSAGYDGGDAGAFVAAGFNYHSYSSSNFRSIEVPTVGQADYDGILSQIDAVEAAYPATRHRVHVFWQDYSVFFDPAPFPGSAQNFADWKAALDGAYGAWAIALVDNLRAARPALDIEIVDCTNLFVEILDNELSDFVMTDVLIDGAGHGTAATYALASLIFYRSMYGESAPASYTFPVSVDARVQANYAAILARIDDFFTAGLAVSGDATASADATGAVGLGQGAAGDATASADAAGAVDLDQSLSGGATGSADAVGGVAAIDTISGDATATGDAAGAVVLDQALSGAAAGSADAAGDATLAAGASPPTAVTFDGVNDHLTGFGLGAAVTEFTFVIQVNGAFPAGAHIINAADPFSCFFSAEDRFAWYIDAVAGDAFGFADMPNAPGSDCTIMVAISQSGALPGGNTLQIHVDGVLIHFRTGAVTALNMAGLFVMAGEGTATPWWATDAYRLWISQTAALDGGDSAIWDAFATPTHGPAGLAAPGTVGGVAPTRWIEGPDTVWNASGYMTGAVVDA